MFITRELIRVCFFCISLYVAVLYYISQENCLKIRIEKYCLNWSFIKGLLNLKITFRFWDFTIDVLFKSTVLYLCLMLNVSGILGNTFLFHWLWIILFRDVLQSLSDHIGTAAQTHSWKLPSTTTLATKQLQQRWLGFRALLKGTSEVVIRKGMCCFFPFTCFSIL